MARAIDIQPIIEEIKSSLDISSYSEHDKGFDDGLEYVLDLIEKAPTLTQPNEPLTLEELREMDEPTPVWWKKAGYWCLCERGFIIAPNGNIYEFEENNWTFYRRPLEGEEEEKHVIEITENL